MQALINDAKKNALLVSLLLVLVLMKFIVSPLLEWQSTIIAEQQTSMQRLSKATWVVDRFEENQATLTRLVSENEKVNVLAHPFTDKTTFQLNQQQQFELLVKELDLQINSVEWQGVKPLVEAGLNLHTFNVRLTGDGYQMFLLQNRLSQRANIEMFNIDITGQREGLGRFTANFLIGYLQQATGVTNE